MRVILVTDGDKVARRTLETAAERLGLRCISASAGNPTPLTGPEIVSLIRQARYDPVLVMADDKGHPGQGKGEEALAYIASCEGIEVIGAIAVASHTRHTLGVAVDLSVTRDGGLVAAPVDKEGRPLTGRDRLQGDTVDILSRLDIPVVVGIGDIGKMAGADYIQNGALITTRAIMEVLDRSVGRASLSEPPPGSHDGGGG